MTANLVATIEQRRSGARVIKLTGVLDEHNELGELIDKVGTGTALINLAGVERINSSGARDWVNWLATLEARGIRPVLLACSPAVVAQLNRIRNFAGNAVVKSFNAPYHCEQCDRDKLLLVHISDLHGVPAEPPACACDACGEPMTFVDESQTYFSFVSQLPKPEPKKPEPAPESAPDLARGSSAGVNSVTSEQISKISQPRLRDRGSRPSLSVFQLPDAKRQSERELALPPPMPEPTERPYFIVIIALLLGTIGVLLFLLMD